MKVNVFFFSILASLLVNVPTYADELEKLLRSNPYKEFDKKTNKDISTINKKWVRPEGSYGSLFKSDDSINQVYNWLSTKSDLFTLTGKKNVQIGNTYFLQQEFSIDDHSPLKVEIYIPHPRHLEEARYGLLDAYKKLTPEAMNVDFHEKTTIQNYDAVLYVIKDKSCRVQINMPHEVRLYLVGQYNELDTLRKLGEELSLTRFETKLEN